MSKLADRIKAAEKQIVLPQYQPWLRNHADEALPKWVLDIIVEQMGKPPRVRSGSFSSSSAGSCLRAQELEYIGAKVDSAQQPDSELSNIYNDGKWRHLRHQANLLTAKIIDSIEVPVMWPEMRSRGTMDGKGTVPNDHPNKKWRGKPYGLELKGMFSWQYAKRVKNDDPKESHLDQITRYMLASGIDLFVYLVENKDTNTWWEKVFEPDPRRMANQRRELERLNKAVDEGKLHKPLLSCSNRIGGQWNNCGFAGEYSTCERASSTWMRKWKERNQDAEHD